MARPDQSTDPRVAVATEAPSSGPDDARVTGLLSATDADSLAQLTEWLAENSRTFAPLVMSVAATEPGLSPQAAATVLDAIGWRAQADEAAMLEVMEVCLNRVSLQITESLADGGSGVIDENHDALVGSAVAVLTADRRSRHSEAAIRCLADAGPGGALVLARAFDTLRDGLQLYILRRMSPADVVVLDDNVVISLADSATKLAEQLERPKRDVATRFLSELGPIDTCQASEIGADDALGEGDAVFHARWGTGLVVAASDETATIDFGNAGTRTLLRGLTTLRRAGTGWRA